MDGNNEVIVTARNLDLTLEEEMQQLKDMFAEVRFEVNAMVQRLTTRMKNTEAVLDRTMNEMQGKVQGYIKRPKKIFKKPLESANLSNTLIPHTFPDIETISEESTMSTSVITIPSILIKAPSINSFTNHDFYTEYNNNNATATGITSTISPIITSPEIATTYILINDNDNNICDNNYNCDNNDISESIVYEEELSSLHAIDELNLSTDDQDFVNSIRNPTFSGIYLSSTCDYSSLKVPILSGVDNSVDVPKELMILRDESFTCKMYYDVSDSFLMSNYNLNINLTININDQYRFFFWDPGIFDYIFNIASFYVTTL